MGLDMYVSANRFLHKGNPARTAIKEALDFDNGDQFVEVKADVMYWRKANAIHQWFVANVQRGNDDCRGYDVSREQLLELSQCCKSVLKDHDQAQQYLPTTSGFFFGSTEYDAWYFDDIKYTAEAIDDLLKDPQYENWYFKYQSSW